MKLKFLFFLLPICLGLAFPLFIGCDRLAPLSAIPVPSQIIWANGSYGTWLNNTLTFGCGGCSTNGAVTTVSDPISGDTQALLLTAAVPFGYYYFQDTPVTAVDPSIYYSSGHLQFDILLGQPSTDFTSMYLQYVNNSGSGNCGGYNFPASLMNSFSPSSFTHVSIPFASFTSTNSGCNGYIQNSVDTPFQLTWIVSSSGTTITLDNIRWTYN